MNPGKIAPERSGGCLAGPASSGGIEKPYLFEELFGLA